MSNNENIGYTRTEVHLYLEANVNSPILDTLCANVSVIIIDQNEDWLHVRPLGLFSGYLPKEYVLTRKEHSNNNDEIFPIISSENFNVNLPAIPEDINPRDLTHWLSTGGKPPWIPEHYWNTLSAPLQQGIIYSVKTGIINRINEWNNWIAELQKQKRLEEAKISEWFTIVRGGKDYFSLTNVKLFRNSKEDNKEFIGWINQNNIVKWTGHIKKDDANPNTNWYEIVTNRLGKEVKGWINNFTSFDEFIFPNENNDPSLEENSEKVFNLHEALLKFPTDDEIAEAIEKGRNAAQYIDLKEVLGYSLLHYNLCGIFAIAALAGVNVIPMMKKWLEVYPRAKKIITNPQEGTSLTDLQSLLDLYHITYERVQFNKVENNLLILSAARLRERLHKGFMLLIGVSVKGNGKLSGEGNIRHWVVIEDSIPVGVSGWIRLYNSFRNGDEVYTHQKFIDAVKGFGSVNGLGLWIKHPRIPSLTP